MREEQAGKLINYSNPALGNSIDSSGVENYNDNHKHNVKFKNKDNDRDNYKDMDN